MLTAPKKKTGRPSFHIDPYRLLGLRKEAGLTQAEVAKKVYRLLRKPGASATKHYQKIEKSGKTSRATAQALASVLDTPLGVLLGQDPNDAASGIDRLEEQLRQQRAAGNTALNAALARWTDPGDTNAARSLAIQLLGRIEAAQIGQHPEELDALAGLTGWSREQLMQSASIEGHWLVVSDQYGVRRTEIVLGAHVLRDRIEQYAADFSTAGRSDGLITFREELPWLHVELTFPHVTRPRYAFSFVRCKPLATGLKWIDPTWRDRFWLDEPLLSWAFTNSNFVVGYDGQSWPGDVRKLRLLLQEFRKGATEPKSAALIKGNLDELEESVLEIFRSEGSTHSLALNWMNSGIWPELKDRLGEWPRSCWKISTNPVGSVIDFVLQVPYRVARDLGRKPRFGLRTACAWSRKSGKSNFDPRPGAGRAQKSSRSRSRSCSTAKVRSPLSRMASRIPPILP